MRGVNSFAFIIIFGSLVLTSFFISWILLCIVSTIVLSGMFLPVHFVVVVVVIFSSCMMLFYVCGC